MIKYYLTPEARALGIDFDFPRYGDIGIDLFALDDVRIWAGTSEKIHTGVHVRLQDNTVGLIKDRSSVAINHGLHVLAGVIDPSYTGELIVVMHNLTGRRVDIKSRAKIAQLLVLPAFSRELFLTAAVLVSSLDELGETERGSGGFGSTGT